MIAQIIIILVNHITTMIITFLCTLFGTDFPFNSPTELITGLSVFGGVVFASVVVEYYFIYKKELSKYNLEDIEQEIKEKSNELILKKNIQKQNVKDIEIKNQYQQDLQKQIDDIINRISTIVKVRSEVIKDFCKDNPQLDNLLNNAYDKQVEQGIKTKVLQKANIKNPNSNTI